MRSATAFPLRLQRGACRCRPHGRHFPSILVLWNNVKGGSMSTPRRRGGLLARTREPSNSGSWPTDPVPSCERGASLKSHSSAEFRGSPRSHQPALSSLPASQLEYYHARKLVSQNVFLDEYVTRLSVGWKRKHGDLVVAMFDNNGSSRRPNAGSGGRARGREGR
jgi:hypothetical protein